MNPEHLESLPKMILYLVHILGFERGFEMLNDLFDYVSHFIGPIHYHPFRLSGNKHLW